MGAKYCLVKGCSENNGKPCAVADDCPFFKWDIEKQKEMLNGEANGKRESVGKGNPRQSV
jgi:hypothetical protein